MSLTVSLDDQLPASEVPEPFLPSDGSRLCEAMLPQDHLSTSSSVAQSAGGQPIVTAVHGSTINNVNQPSDLVRRDIRGKRMIRSLVSLIFLLEKAPDWGVAGGGGGGVQTEVGRISEGRSAGVCR